MKQKHAILNLLYEKEIMRKMHENLLSGLVGPLVDEYRGSNWGEWPTSPPNAIAPPPIFRAVVDMFVSNIMHHLADDLIEEVVDTVLENHELINPDCAKRR